MLVSELYATTKALFFEKENSTIYDSYLIPNLNRVIRDCFDYNNNERMFNDKAPLQSVPYVSTFNDELVYEDVYLHQIMPIGLAAYLLIDDDLSKYSIYITDYKNELIKNQKVVSKEKIDGFTTNAQV